MNYYLIPTVLALFLLGCSSEPEQSYNASNNNKQDSTEQNDSLAKMNDTLSSDSSSNKKVSPVDVRDSDGYEDDDAAEKIVKANKKQLSFCDCAKKMNKIENELQEAEGDKFDQLFEKMEKLQKNKCAVLFVSSNRTPDERAAHKRKVKKCLED